jgi:hypothetical protein
MPHAIERKYRLLRPVNRRALCRARKNVTRQAGHAVSREMSPCPDSENARGCNCFGYVDVYQTSMCARGPQYHGMQHAWHPDVIDVLRRTREKSMVFDTSNRRPDGFRFPSLLRCHACCMHARHPI